MNRIIVTPAGRKKYLEILYQYLLKAFQKNEFKEWHLWMNTKNEVDNLYMNELAKNNEWIKLIYWCEEKYYPKAIDAELWKNIHKFYSIDSTDPSAVYLELDDDIVYIEDGAINNIFEFRISNPQYFLVYGNIINNSVHGHLHQRLGIVDYSKGINQFNCFCNIGWKSGEYVKLVHNTFLANVEVKELDKYKFPRWELWNIERVSINVVSWLGLDFAKFSGLVLQDEELDLSINIPKRFNKINCINGQAVFSHYAYFTQRDYLDQTEILNDYKKLSGANKPTLIMEKFGFNKNIKADNEYEL
ncbi:MAG: hypothetical protein M1419_00565 [Bacteroidetes bacterium]|nr:hypothetical protein [Bacteroidota bacterium]